MPFFAKGWLAQPSLTSSQIKVRARVLEVTADCWILSVSPVSTTSQLQCGQRESMTEDLPGTTWAQPCPRVPQVGLVLQSGSCTSLSVRELSSLTLLSSLSEMHFDSEQKPNV